MTDFIFPKILGYEFLAPRNKIAVPFETIFAAEDNNLHYSLNGTYDKHYPLYALTNIQGASTNYRPTINIINNLGLETKLDGVVSPVVFKEKINRREIGKKEEIHPFFGNRGLKLNRIYYREFLIPKFDPRYSLVIDGVFITNVIQDKITQAIDLGKNTTSSSFEPFQKGTLVKYSDKYWKCQEPTTEFPTEEDDNWEQLSERQSIFRADIYSIFGNNVQFLQTYAEDRSFDPTQQDESLVTWNLSCFFN